MRGRGWMRSVSASTSWGSIHKQLYSSRNFARIDLGLHLEELCENLNSLYGFPPASLSSWKRKRWNAVLDTAIPLGLIANEAISNSLKHAFPKAGPAEFSSACAGSAMRPPPAIKSNC